jgi:hypothetical protein
MHGHMNIKDRDSLRFPTNWMHRLVFSVSLVTRPRAGHQRIDIQFAVWTETCLFTVGWGLSWSYRSHVHCQLGFLQKVWFEFNKIITDSLWLWGK